MTAGRTTKPMGIRDVLRIRDYRNLFGGQAVSDIGDGITLLLLLLVIHGLTGSYSALALMAIAEAVPHLRRVSRFPRAAFAGSGNQRPARRRPAAARCPSWQIRGTNRGGSAPRWPLATAAGKPAPPCRPRGDQSGAFPPG